MYSEKFLRLARGYESKLEELKTKDIQEYILELNNFSSNMEIILPDEMSKFLKEIEIDSDFKLWKESSLSMLKELDEYGVDIENKVVFVKKGEDRIEMPLLDINSYIDQKVQNKDLWVKVLALSFMIRPENYEYYQITNSLILGE